MSAYYNEFDPFAAQWLRNLIDAKLIASGEVDERSIVDVRADDLRGFSQCHFFAGIGGWSHGFRLAGWPDDRPAWSASLPCQPFSAAGKQKGKEDLRHLLPVFLGLVCESKPPVIFGEQVTSAIAHGWLDDVYQGLEGEGYAVGSAVLPACGVGAPRRRERLWFVADADQIMLNGSGNAGARRWSESSDGSRDVAHPDLPRLEGWGVLSQRADKLSLGSSGVAWLQCADGKARPVEPSIPLLAHGIPGRVGKLRGYGNAIVPQVAAEFIRAFMETR